MVKLGLTKLKRLRRIEVHSTRRHPDFGPWLYAELEEQSGLSRLESVVVRIRPTIPRRPSPVNWREYASWAPWGATLASRSRFPELKSVIIELEIGPGPLSEAEKRTHEGVVISAFPELDLKGILNVEWTSVEGPH